MNEQQKYLAATSISLIATLVLIPTVIGSIIFGALAIGFAVKWLSVRGDGGRPWWTKSFVTLWRERGDSDDE